LKLRAEFISDCLVQTGSKCSRLAIYFIIRSIGTWLGVARVTAARLGDDGADAFDRQHRCPCAHQRAVIIVAEASGGVFRQNRLALGRNDALEPVAPETASGQPRFGGEESAISGDVDLTKTEVMSACRTTDTLNILHYPKLRGLATPSCSCCRRITKTSWHRPRTISPSRRS
jgi:hypothetical protein